MKRHLLGIARREIERHLSNVREWRRVLGIDPSAGGIEREVWLALNRAAAGLADLDDKLQEAIKDK